MNIKPNASPDEFSSPFFKENEKFCFEFEKYISEKGGKTSGRYNAFSYSIIGKINVPKPWTLRYKKSSYTGTGNLFLSTAYESFLVLLEWKTKRIINSNIDFIIRKKSKIEFLFKLLNQKNENLINKKYILKWKQSKPLFMDEMLYILAEPLQKNEIYEIELKKGILRIELRTKRHYFDIFEKLSEM